MMHRNLLIFLFLLVATCAQAQNLRQTIRGTITDKISGEALTGAIVTLPDLQPVIGATSDLDGNFKIENVAVGRHRLQVVMLGYKTIAMNEVLVTSGKELILTIHMEEELQTAAEVTVTADKEKTGVLNSMAGVSARSFSVEETQKFAAAVNDPARAAVSFAGVVSGDDGGNLISIRGNSPYGLLWRMEGVDIPNPNHFAGTATSGGGISILSAQVLSNSDFFTGAFPAEYGNALSGVFDMKLRKGNNEKREYTLQAGVLGLDFAAEGPFKKGYGGSYLVNYRYSTLSLLAKMGVPIGDAVTNFQDLSWNIALPTARAGNFQIFGFGGLSSQTSEAKRDTAKWEYDWQRYDSRYHSNTGAAGIRHIIHLCEDAYLTSSLVASGHDVGYSQEKLDDHFKGFRDYQESHFNGKLMLTSVYNQKFNARHSLRTGIYYNYYGFNLLQEVLNKEANRMETQLDATGKLSTWQGFAQWKNRVNSRLTTNLGVHSLFLPSNQTWSLEPRASLRYQMNEVNTLSLGYGMHAQMQPVGIYEAQVLNAEGRYIKPNKDLGMNKAQHFVAGYERSITPYMYVKTEVYYQHLYNMAIAADSGSTYSTINNVGNYDVMKMNNEGLGRNYGVELTAEQFMHNRMYFLLSASLYNSEYRAMDGVWRNTRYNGHYALTFTAGKEWAIGQSEKNRTFGLNLRVIYRGGLRTSPIDVEASMANGRTEYVESELYSIQVADYFRTDLRMSIRRNREHSTSTLALDLQNASSRKNVAGQYFDPQSGLIRTAYQVPLIPVLSYKLEF